jgi:hypothetical protein
MRELLMYASCFGLMPKILSVFALKVVTSVIFGFAQHVILLGAARFAQGAGGACSWAAGLAWLVRAKPSDRLVLRPSILHQ